MHEVRLTLEIDGLKYGTVFHCGSERGAVSRVVGQLQGALNDTLVEHFKGVREGWIK
jgi:hypothetical protein